MVRSKTHSLSKKELNRGAWTAQEDMTLINYIQTMGETGWRSLPKKAGLNRCGKSCRLRWLNYLRPDIKRGNISPDEEELIIRMHRLLGNRWSLIAGRLPGRTDNEIKNYWNTHLSKKLALSSSSVKSRDSMGRSSSAQPEEHSPSWDSREDNVMPSTVRLALHNQVSSSSYLEEMNLTQELDVFESWSQFLGDPLMADVREYPHNELNNGCYMFEPIPTPIEPLSESPCSTSSSDLALTELENGSSHLLDFNSFVLPCTDLEMQGDLSVENSLQPTAYILENIISSVKGCDSYDDRNCFEMAAEKGMAEICDIQQPQQQCYKQSSENNLDELWQLFEHQENSEDLVVTGLTKEEYRHLFVDTCN